MDLFEDALKIYSLKSREYFKEVVSSYANGNYRSAVVMLYSVCICDLLFKLQELKDMYNDGIAKNIIADIEKNKENSTSKSSWEKELVEQIHNKTNLLDLEAYTNLSHLYDYRNLSAHPALNGELDLISPQKEVVAAYIRTSLDTILLKPSIFIRDIIEVMSNDLDEKKYYILQDNEVFEKYIKTKYLDRMLDAMYVKVFKTFWRFAFKTTDESCSKNRYVNARVIGIMYETRGVIIEKELSSNNDQYEVAADKVIYEPIMKFMADYPKIHTLLSEHIKKLISSIATKNNEYKLIAWFTSNKKEHIQNMIKSNQYIYTENKDVIDYFVRKNEEDGLINECLDYLIEVVGKATTYPNAGNRIEHYIFPYLSKMKFRHFELIFKTIETCNNLKDNMYLGSMYCPTIWKYALNTLPEGYDMTPFPHFKIPETIEE